LPPKRRGGPHRRDRVAETIDHPGGTLYAHLDRIHDRLVGLCPGGDVALALGA